MTTTNPPSDETGPATGPARRTLKAATLEGWARATAPGTFLGRRGQDVRHALDHGWRCGARWVRLAAGLLILLAASAGAVLLCSALRQFLAASGAGTWLAVITRTVTGPVHHYLAEHTAGLPLSGADAYRLWAATGLTAAVLSFALRSTTARFVWAGWSAGTLAAVWQASPDGGRPVATALTAAVLAAVSAPALRGLAVSLRPQVTVHDTLTVVLTAQVCACRWNNPAVHLVVPAPRARS
ncbi:hypothetical protein ABT093_30675 [Kitasatospora sp. NPDC002551]|uniref:hypothetical protein n=1 Tax=Kitasatospora sp. NPDC002551 TaxID=3154539 RepID=UPI00331AC38E